MSGCGEGHEPPRECPWAVLANTAMRRYSYPKRSTKQLWWYRLPGWTIHLSLRLLSHHRVEQIQCCRHISLYGIMISWQENMVPCAHLTIKMDPLLLLSSYNTMHEGNAYTTVKEGCYVLRLWDLGVTKQQWWRIEVHRQPVSSHTMCFVMILLALRHLNWCSIAKQHCWLTLSFGKCFRKKYRGNITTWKRPDWLNLKRKELDDSKKQNKISLKLKRSKKKRMTGNMLNWLLKDWAASPAKCLWQCN